MKPLQYRRSAAVLAGFLALTACPKRPESAEPSYSSNDGTESTPSAPSGGVQLPSAPRQTIHQDSRAEDALSNARSTVGTQSRRAAVETYMAVYRAYPATTAGEQALYQAGTLAFDLGDYATARKALNQLLFENPLFERAQDAKAKLGEAALQTHAYRDAYQTLSSLAERAQGEEKARLLDAAGKAAEGGQLWGPALQIALRFLDDAQAQGPDAVKARMDRVVDLVEGKVPFPEVARLQAELPATSPAWPVLTFKLGRVYEHLRDLPREQQTLQQLLAQAPQSAYAAQAQSMLAHAGQTGRVRPRVVGVVLPLTGTYKAVGEAFLRGIQLGLKNSDVELVVKDSAGDPTRAGKAVEDLALQDGAIAILGPVVGDESKRAAIVAEQVGIPLLTMTRLEGITELGPHVFRNMLTYSAQTKALVDFGTNVLGFKSYAMLYPNAPYGKEFANDFWEDVEDAGGQIRAAESYAYRQSTLSTEVKRLVGRDPLSLEDRKEFVEAVKEVRESSADSFRKRKALEKLRSNVEPIVDFDAVFVPDDWTQVGQVAPALAVEDIITNACDAREMDKLKKTFNKEEVKTVTLMGTSLWSSPKNAAGVPGLLERGGKFVVCSVYVDGFFADSPRPATRRFVKQYEEAHRDAPVPGLFEATAYDSARMIRHVIERANPQTREDLRNGLAALRNFDGATGKTSFSARREPDKTPFFLTVDNKGIHEMTEKDKEKEKGREKSRG